MNIITRKYRVIKLNNRQEIKFAVHHRKNYIKDAEPVGSKFLISNFDLEIGEATARNEMRSLEEQGFLSHHTLHQVRIPTETGYKYYINNLMKPKKISTRDSEDIIKILAEKDEENRLKLLGKILAEKTGLAVIVNIKKDFIYYTGLSNLFSQPEFRDYNLTINVSGIFDRCEHRIVI
jgi:transcriptional regulator of heat shock response